MSTYRRDKKWLLDTAKVVASMLKERRAGTAMTIRQPSAAVETTTGGWGVVIGNLGKNQPKIEIWLDKFAGYPDRKLYACLRSEDQKALTKIVGNVSRHLWPVRVITLKDTDIENYLVLKKPLGRAEFNAPILEKYTPDNAFFGVYDLTRESTDRINLHFCERAAAFFEDVARSLPSAREENERHDVYPRHENRQQVVSHLQRERSRLLATERKILDDYKCQVCGLKFEKMYGKELGAGFAEAHHLVPLSQLKGVVKTSLDDLRTVCANCHRMLHRMEGKRDDITKLRAIVKRNRGAK
ncbi:MAG TPA: HNH endonuclease [Anaerolineales bacterium]|nr:HNH endonuclease [Anaerolineales bacterium]